MDGSGSVADGLELRLMFPAGRDVTVEASGELDLASAHRGRRGLPALPPADAGAQGGCDPIRRSVNPCDCSTPSARSR